MIDMHMYIIPLHTFAVYIVKLQICINKHLITYVVSILPFTALELCLYIVLHIATYFVDYKQPTIAI